MSTLLYKATARILERFVLTKPALFVEAGMAISQEYRALMQRDAGREQRLFEALIYIHPVQVRDRDRLSRAFARAGRQPVGGGAPIAVPFLNGAFRAGTNAVSADQAAARFLTLVRDALQACDLVIDEIRIEAIPGDEA